MTVLRAKVSIDFAGDTTHGAFLGCSVRLPLTLEASNDKVCKMIASEYNHGLHVYIIVTETKQKAITRHRQTDGRGTRNRKCHLQCFQSSTKLVLWALETPIFCTDGQTNIIISVHGK